MATKTKSKPQVELCRFNDDAGIRLGLNHPKVSPIGIGKDPVKLLAKQLAGK